MNKILVDITDKFYQTFKNEMSEALHKLFQRIRKMGLFPNSLNDPCKFRYQNSIVQGKVTGKAVMKRKSLNENISILNPAIYKLNKLDLP